MKQSWIDASKELAEVMKERGLAQARELDSLRKRGGETPW